MTELTALAASAAGVAVLGRAGAIDEVVDLAQGDVAGLRDAQDLVRSLSIDRAARDRALVVVERAIQRIEHHPD